MYVKVRVPEVGATGPALLLIGASVGGSTGLGKGRAIMRKMLVVAGLLMLVGASARAQDTNAVDGQQFQRKTVINFEDDTIEGDLKTPDGEYLEARKKARHKSLIKIRENFRRRILQSAGSL
jgi:hypothetical protein